MHCYQHNQCTSPHTRTLLQEKTEAEPALTPRLAQARDEAIQLALVAGRVQRECGLDILPEEFVVNTLKFGLMEVGVHWGRGDVFRGTKIEVGGGGVPTHAGDPAGGVCG